MHYKNIESVGRRRKQQYCVALRQSFDNLIPRSVLDRTLDKGTKTPARGLIIHCEFPCYVEWPHGDFTPFNGHGQLRKCRKTTYWEIRAQLTTNTLNGNQHIVNTITMVTIILIICQDVQAVGAHEFRCSRRMFRTEWKTKGER